MPVQSEAQRRLMQAICSGKLRGEDLPSKPEACEYLRKTPESADLPGAWMMDDVFGARVDARYRNRRPSTSQYQARAARPRNDLPAEGIPTNKGVNPVSYQIKHHSGWTGKPVVHTYEGSESGARAWAEGLSRDSGGRKAECIHVADGPYDHSGKATHILTVGHDD